MNILILNSQKKNYFLNKLRNIILKECKDKVIVFKKKVTAEFIKKKKIGVIISFHYKYIVPHKILKIVNFKAINFHNSLLPKNKGMHPVLWSSVHNNFGICLHLLSRKIDEGDLIFRKKIKIERNKNLFFAYNFIEKKSLTEFKKIWGKLYKNFLENKNVKTIVQNKKKATYNNNFKSNILISSLKYGWKTKIGDVRKNYKLIKRNFK